MRILILVALAVSLHATIDQKWSSNKNCQACHQKISKSWETSRHSNSHFTKNDLFKKSLEYIVLKNPKMVLEEIKVDCARCHNPRIAKDHLRTDEKILLALENDTTKEEFQDMLNAEHMKNGINCIVCHNVDEIHLDKGKGSQGLGSVKFGVQGTMFGPFNDAVSPYHKTAQRGHFASDTPDLCFVCHYSTKNRHGVEVYSTGKEYDAGSNGNEGCRDCHMSEKKDGFASNYAKADAKPVPRSVRDHVFASVDNSDILAKYVSIAVQKVENKVEVTLTNNSPHRVPTGYGLRELYVKVEFLDINNKSLGKDSKLISAQWKDKEGKATIPHEATSKSMDTRIDPKASRAFMFDIPEGAVKVKYSLGYRLISKEMAELINVEDPFFLREYKTRAQTQAL